MVGYRAWCGFRRSPPFAGVWGMSSGEFGAELWLLRVLETHLGLFRLGLECKGDDW